MQPYTVAERLAVRARTHPFLTLMGFLLILCLAPDQALATAALHQESMMSQQQPSPPIPVPSPQPESDYYWEKCKEGELWLRHCKACDSAYFYPRDICPECFSRDTDWVQSSGKGIVHTFSIVHRGPTPPFRDKAPYVPAIVELAEGPRMPTNLVQVEPDPTVIKVGMAVEVVFEALDETISLPKFKPAT